MKKILFLFVISTLSCTSSKKNLFELYFYKADSFTTIIPVKCDEMDNYNNLMKVNIKDENLYNDLISIIDKQNQINISKDKNLDIRYKIYLNKDTICINDSGEYLLNGKYKGKLGCFKNLLFYINKNKSQAIKITEDITKAFQIEE